MRRTLNLGILAHVDAGKTSLTERLLFAAGIIDTIGSVDDGSTQTDTLALERQRGITIKSAVVSFAINDVTINLIDTPGHPDFIAEVERVLGVLDGAVLVISAVEGVQPQTRVLMRTLQRLNIPALIFVNKLDRAGAGYHRILRDIAGKLTPAALPMGSAGGRGTRDAGFACFGDTDPGFTSRMVDLLADHDEPFLAAYVNDEAAISYDQLREGIAGLTARGLAHPVYFGSAITGAGVDALIDGIQEFLPSLEGDADGPLCSTIFKIERGPAREKVAYVRLFSGAIRVRDRLRFGDEVEGRVTAINVFEAGATVQRPLVTAGQIAKLWGLLDARIGDEIGASRAAHRAHYFAPPMLETAVAPCCPEDRGALYLALSQLAEQDPLINLRKDELRDELFVSLYGEVQKEVIQETLASDFGLEIEFSESKTICIERPLGAGADFEIIAKDPNPFLATVGLRVEPAPIGAGVEFRLEVELGSMPLAFFTAVEESVRQTLQQGLHGWEVTDCLVTMTHSGYWARQSSAHGVFDKSMSSTAGDFRNLTPLVLMSALRQAGTCVYEPVHGFHLEVPADTLGPVLPVLARLRAVPQPPEVRDAACLLEGEIPAASVHELQQLLPALTRGEGVLESGFERYEVVHGTVPTRPRSDHNPLNRKEYLLHTVLRV